MALKNESLGSKKMGMIYPDRMLLSYFYSINNVSDKEQCWFECIKNKQCNAISFCASDWCYGDCYLSEQ